ncbi:hypothetical protein NYO98_13970 [Nocardioides sp. STR2]|uniref:Uncharacterized protein n=1 Tax=Nocardioides pini TaxID=2975053 RepID=A0ABT4CG78_9ACTN|nr:hypothetical protein [Nocardioides pini]MCY4727391.1 hypothetical protein [Nocardioides pini]
MTTKSDFSEEEWTRILRAPFVAGLAISLADPGGPIEAAKETMATMRSATSPPSREQLLADVALDVQGMVQEHRHPLKGYKPTGPAVGDEVVGELREVVGIVAAKASAEETSAYGAWLLASAEAAAAAAKEGGFMGFHAEQVSAGEQAMLDRVREAVTAPA